jgi:hypothetical protein
MSELDDLKKEIADLKQRIDPPPRPPSTWQPHDYTQGMSMARSTMLEMMKVTPEGLMKELRADALKPNPVTGSAPQPQSQPVRRGSGWAKPIPVEPPPGVAILDKIMDEQDRLDRAELVLKFAKAELGKGKGEGG